jgi:arylsulfatase A-like enzyme
MALGVLQFLVLIPPAAASPSFGLRGSRPNILLWLLDDWSYELWPTVDKDDELNTFKDGSSAFPQSNASLRVENAYDALLPHVTEHFVQRGIALRTLYTCQICSPSRRSLLSGRFITTIGKPYGSTQALQVQASTLADRLKAAGYETHHLGERR